MSDIHIQDDAAIVGGVHSDSHDVHNTTNNNTTNNVNTTHNVNQTYNNQTIHAAQKTVAELHQEGEAQFMLAVQQYLADGQLDQQELGQLNILATQLNIAPQRALQMIDQVRRSTLVMKGGQGTEFLAQQLLEEVFNAVNTNQVDILQRRLPQLEQMALTTPDANIQFYFHMLQASLKPESAAIAFLNARTDNYWQLFWVHVAYIKLKQNDNATVLLPRMGGFGAPQGDMALLMAIDNLAEYRKSPGQDYYIIQAQDKLMQAQQLGLSEPLSALWYAVKEAMLDEQNPEEWFRFYVEQTLKELCPVKAPAMPKMPPQMPKMEIPPVPKFNAQNVNLAQMQGFNPLQAAQQMGLGMAGSMKQMGSIGQMAPPPMPSAPVPPPADMKSAPAEQLASEVRQAEEPLDQEDPLEPHYGILLTDSMKLAEKYGCSQQDVYDVFNDFIQTAYDQQMYWSFLDAATTQLGSYESPSWLDYNDQITAFIEEQGLQTGPDLHLFIIGGADVIPIPHVEDPYEHGSGQVPTDMCYAYPDTFIIDLIDGGIGELDINSVRNNVARLPLEDGEMQSDIQSDLAAYFNISGLYAGGIPVGNVVMASNADWIPASVTMSEHLPLLFSADDPELVRNGMYISPKLLTCDDESMSIYKQSLGQADLLMFNLHGADAPSMPGFYSNDEAFNPSLLRESNARVFNTVACFGARYSGYERSQSMLLSSLYGGGVLLYTGSLISVPMYYDPSTNEARELLLNPGTGSEVLMRLYALYQFKGLTMGRALLQAKFDYFNMCRHVESDGFSFSTILMFSLYGNPMLHVRRREHVLQAALENDAMPPAPVKGESLPIRKATVQRLLDNKQQPQSLLDQVRGAVDANLEAIRQTVEQHLYQALGLPPRLLDSIDQVVRLADSGMEEGYSFNYHDPDSPFAADIFAEVDKQGRLKRVYTTK